MPDSTSKDGPRDPSHKTARRQDAVQPFTVEFDLPNNRTATINHLKVNARGKFSMAKLHRVGTVGPSIGNMPDIPGMQLTINPQDKTAELSDPLEHQPELIAKINAVLRQAPAAFRGAKNTFVPRQKFKLDDPDKLKSLVWEIADKIKIGDCRVVKGTAPTDRQVSEMDGDLLYGPWNTGRKPKYRHEVYAWERELDAQQV